MDACDPGINIRNLKKLVKQNTGLELKLTRAEICDAYSSIQDGKLPLPPMVLSKDGKYMLDRKSPLNGRDFEILFSGSSTLAQLKRVARKAGLSSYDKMTKSQISDAIESTLKSKNIREPIRLHISVQKRVVSVNKNNDENYPSNFNVNNKNGNNARNNLSKISKESENLGEPKNNQNETKNLNRISNESKNLNNGGNNNTKSPVNGTTARYLNAMTRRPNVNRNADIAKILSAMKNKNQTPGNISRLIESVQRKKSVNGETKAYLNKFIRAQKQGNMASMQNAAKRLNAFERNKRSTINAPPPVNQKQKKLANIEKYMINKSKNLGTNRVKFLNESQKYIRGYKNGNNMYNTTKARINSLHNEIYKKKLNETKISNVVNSLQKNKINKIVNTKIKNEASRLLEEFKKTGSNTTRDQIIKLQGLDQGLREKEDSSTKILGSIQPLNAVRNEALQNISSYNIRNGLAKINAQIQQTKNERRKRINSLFESNKYKNVRTNTRKYLTNKYINGHINWNSVIQNLNFSATPTPTPNNERRTGGLQPQRLVFSNNSTPQNPTKQKENSIKETANPTNKLQNNKNLSNEEKRALQQQLNNQLRNSEAEITKITENLKSRNQKIARLMNESGSKNMELANLRNKKQRAEAIIKKLMNNQKSKNAEIQSLRESTSKPNLTIQQKNELQNLLKERNELQRKLNQEQSDKKLTNAIHKNLLKDKQKKISEISQQRELLRASKTLAEEKITEITKNLKSRNQKIARLMNESGSKNMELANLRNKKQKAQSIIKKLANKQKNQNLTIKQRNGLKELLNKSRRKKESLETQIKQLTEQIEANMSQKEELTATTTQQKILISRLSEQVKKLEKELKNAQQKLAASNNSKGLVTKTQEGALKKQIRAGERNLSKVTGVNWRKENPFAPNKNPATPTPPIIQKYRKQPIPYVNTRQLVNRRKKSYANVVRGSKKQRANVESVLKRL